MKVLIISPYFPPYSGVASIRMSSLSRFLIYKGADITVIKNSNKMYPCSSLKEDFIDKINIIEIDSANDENSLVNCYFNALDSILDKEHFDVVIVSVGPFYTLPAVTKAYEKYKFKYIIDYRDLWIFNSSKKINSLRVLLGKLLGYFKNIKHYFKEYRAIMYSEGLVTVCEGDLNILKFAYYKFRSKMYVIKNGYDELEVINKTDFSFKKNEINIGHFGKLSIYSKDKAEVLFEALRHFDNKNIKINIVHIGQEENRIHDIVSKHDFNRNVYTNTGVVAYSEGIAILKEMDMCSLIHVHPTGYGTKIFDYIYVNKPIIAITSPNIAINSLIDNFSNAFICNNSADVINAIETVLQEKIRILDNNLNIGEYSRSNRNLEYYNLCKNIIYR